MSVDLRRECRLKAHCRTRHRRRCNCYWTSRCVARTDNEPIGIHLSGSVSGLVFSRRGVGGDGDVLQIKQQGSDFKFTS